MINLFKRQLCQFPIEIRNKCPHNAKVEIMRPNPIDPTLYPQYLCYSHLSAFARRFRGQFLVSSFNQPVEARPIRKGKNSVE